MIEPGGRESEPFSITAQFPPSDGMLIEKWDDLIAKAGSLPAAFDRFVETRPRRLEPRDHLLPEIGLVLARLGNHLEEVPVTKCAEFQRAMDRMISAYSGPQISNSNLVLMANRYNWTGWQVRSLSKLCIPMPAESDIPTCLLWRPVLQVVQAAWPNDTNVVRGLCRVQLDGAPVDEVSYVQILDPVAMYTAMSLIAPIMEAARNNLSPCSTVGSERAPELQGLANLQGLHSNLSPRRT